MTAPSLVALTQCAHGKAFSVSASQFPLGETGPSAKNFLCRKSHNGITYCKSLPWWHCRQCGPWKAFDVSSSSYRFRPRESSKGTRFLDAIPFGKLTIDLAGVSNKAAQLPSPRRRRHGSANPQRLIEPIKTNPSGKIIPPAAGGVFFPCNRPEKHNEPSYFP